MSRRSRKGTKYRHSFVMLPRRMLNDSQWKNLSPAAKLLYIHLKAKYNGINNGSIRLYYSELQGIKGISSPSTISKAIKELEEKRWIRRAKIGGLFRYNNEYQLTGKYDECLNG